MGKDGKLILFCLSSLLLIPFIIHYDAFAIDDTSGDGTASHSFEFNGNLDDSLTDLSLTNPNGGTVTSTTYVFEEGQGLQGQDFLTFSNESPETYSVEMCLKITDNEDWRKLIDFKSLDQDEGLYVTPDDELGFYDEAYGETTIPGDTLFHVIMTRDMYTNQVVGYLDGSKEFSFTDNGGLAIPELNEWYFVKDDFDTNESEETSGTLNYIKIYDHVLNQDQISSKVNQCVPESESEPALLKHFYEFKDNFEDTLGGPTLTAPDGGTPEGTLGSYHFEDGQGLELSSPQVSSDNYSIEMCLKVGDGNDNQYPGWRKLVDFKDFDNDMGIYVTGPDYGPPADKLMFYNEATGTSTVPTDEFFHFVLTRDGNTDNVQAYLDGVSEFSFNDSGDLAVFDKPNHVIQFIQDDGNGEDPDGTLAYIKVYDGVLSSDEIASSSSSCPPPEPEPEPISEIQCTYDDQTDVVLDGVLEYSVSGQCDIYHGDTIVTKDATINVSKEILHGENDQMNGEGTLFVAVDSEDFASSLPDKIAKITTEGPTVLSNTIIETDFPVNGLADGGDFMFAGTPNQNILQKVDFDGNLISTVNAEFPSTCCNEDMALDPIPTNDRPNGTLYHAHWSNNIQAIDPVTGALFETFPIPDVVGIAYVGDEIWISKWSAREVGRWDPNTNNFTPVFSTPSNAGMLAYDPFNEILWVGMSGGVVRPYDLTGNQLGSDFIPFTGVGGTVDGGFFLGESSASFCDDQTGIFTIVFDDESGSIIVNEQGGICQQGNNIEFSGTITSTQGSGEYENLPLQCGDVDADVILNNDSASGTVSITQCPVIQKSGGGDNNWDTRPTYGISHEDRETQVVENGFTFNNEQFTITDNHWTPFEEQSIEIGTVNTFSAKVYADKRLKVQEFLFGIPDVGESQLAELGVEVWYDFDGNIDDVKVVQKSDVIDADTVSVSHEKTKCLATDPEPLCDTTTVSMTFLEPLKDKVMAIKAIDFKNRDQRTYLNEGFDISGDSLNPMLTNMIPSNIRDAGLLKVTQLAKYSPYWKSDDGRMFEMNSFGSFKEINQSFERFQDKGDAKTRLHSGFEGIVEHEQQRATQIFNSSELASELPSSFAYIFPDSGQRLTDDMIQEMIHQEELAKNILDEMDKQTRYY